MAYPFGENPRIQTDPAREINLFSRVGFNDFLNSYPTTAIGAERFRQLYDIAWEQVCDYALVSPDNSYETATDEPTPHLASSADQTEPSLRDKDTALVDPLWVEFCNKTTPQNTPANTVDSEEIWSDFYNSLEPNGTEPKPDEEIGNILSRIWEMYDNPDTQPYLTFAQTLYFARDEVLAVGEILENPKLYYHEVKFQEAIKELCRKGNYTGGGKYESTERTALVVVNYISTMICTDLATAPEHTDRVDAMVTLQKILHGSNGDRNT